jgi:hypothetical protein
MTVYTDNSGHPDDGVLISYTTLRKIIGILGIALPFVCVFGSSALSGCWCLDTSISFFYFTKMGGVIVGTLCLLGVFLLVNTAFDLQDIIISKLAGTCAILIALFPARKTTGWNTCDIVILEASKSSDMVHSVATAVFFAALIYMSLFLFTKDGGAPTPQKLKRNLAYRICGYTMLASCIFLGICYKGWISTSWKNYPLILVFEGVALTAFGVSWLTKGEAILKDKSATTADRNA